ncbi:MAG: nucleotidyl transferase AbiEii/AbiGii toxin family protein [Planctomycetota bacterium]|nr:nucleotidyl transferase AbiEii/AbiGii toxin family protein [Planctomycetota bacterium]
MDKSYFETVQLLLAVTPEVFRNPVFAMKGGTAINLFVRDMPRLSVDIDVVYTPWEPARSEALNDITAELGAIRERLMRLDLAVDTVGSTETGDRTLLVSNDSSVVKVEANIVFRGTVLPVQRCPLAASAAAKFAAELEVPILAPEELYGSKLVAAMDRQHPRDLFDVAAMYEATGLSDAAIECFVTYLAGHNRPTHEVLFGHLKDIALDFHTSFVGMTTHEVALETLLKTRDRLFAEIHARLSADQRQLLVGLARAEPDWSLLQCRHAASLPALQWKLLNLQKFKKTNPEKFEWQAKALEQRLA